MSTAQQHRARHGWRFTLRWLLLLVAILSLPLVLIGQELNHLRLEQTAIAELLRQGAYVESIPSKHWLRGLLDDDKVVTAISVELNHKTHDDSLLAQVGRLHNLRSLRVASPAVTDDGLQHLTNLHELRLLTLRAKNVSDAGVAYFVHLKQLEYLMLQVSLSDVGMAHLAKLERLDHLFVVSRSMEVTDEGLKSLEGLRELTFVSLVCPGASADGFGRLALALPTCEVRNDSWQSYGR